jgi:hypothetical protein
MFTYTKLAMAAIECKLAMVISRLVKFELLLELKIEPKKGTSRDSPSLKQSVRGQYRLSIQMIYINISTWFHSRTSPFIINIVVVVN